MRPWQSKDHHARWHCSPSTLRKAFNQAVNKANIHKHVGVHKRIRLNESSDVGVVYPPIHMNGRIYDPHIARFVQADPFIQAPTDTQMLNRYSYVRNNPLNATNPSGYFIPIIAGIIAKVAFSAGALGIGITVGVSAFAMAFVQGASFGEALKVGVISGISAAAFTALGGVKFGATALGEVIGETATTALAFGFVGGITSVLQGGKFGHGFVAAGFGAAAGIHAGKLGGIFAKPVGRIIAGAVIGGTASELTGGKFANGAATGTFASLAYEGANSYANAHKAPQLNLPEFSVTPESPKMGADLTTGEVELVALDLSAPYEGETFNKVAPVSTLAAGEHNIDWSAVGPTNVFDVPYLDNVGTGYSPTGMEEVQITLHRVFIGDVLIRNERRWGNCSAQQFGYIE